VFKTQQHQSFVTCATPTTTTRPGVPTDMSFRIVYAEPAFVRFDLGKMVEIIVPHIKRIGQIVMIIRPLTKRFGEIMMIIRLCTKRFGEITMIIRLRTKCLGHSFRTCEVMGFL